MSDQTPYGNQIIDLPGITREVVERAADVLMPPQYDEFCRALRGECSPATNAYWKNIADQWAENLAEEQ